MERQSNTELLKAAGVGLAIGTSIGAVFGVVYYLFLLPDIVFLQ